MNHIEIQFHFSSEKSEMMENDYGFYSLFFASFGMQSLSSHQNRNRTIELFSRSLLPVITVNQVSNSLVPFYLSKRFCYTANQMDTISKI